MAGVNEMSEDSELISETIEKLPESVSREGKGKRLWNKVKYQLVEYHSLPGYLRDNEFIVGHYRSEWPLKQVLLSVFTIHNETLNVWTHLIGFFLFLSLTICTAMKVPKAVDLHSLQLPEVHKYDLQKLQECLPSLPNMPHLHKLREELKNTLPSVDLLPSLSGWHVMDLLYNCLPALFSHDLNKWGYLIDNVVLEFVSASDVLALPRAVKEDVANIMAPLMMRPITRLDYAGIAALISTSFFPPVYYSFMCSPFFCNLYMGFITVLGVATILVSLLPVFQNPEFRTVRASLFLGMGLSGIAPVLHKLILFSHQPEALTTTCYEVLMGIFYGLGALVYATRIPERWMPGKFDIAGHSHQLFHVLVVAGAYTHYHTGLVYLKWRDLHGC
ncbi:hypothetical protein OIU77_003641 [Salix suchowensis]|uniref:Uncharacterized protein n=1 Tax=Salix suchowensis TaxID=1278906 RepID=A0ABQ9B254_9ROSI|nr:hypothetical protein OIU77_003641 [Salix suchowensis]